MSILLYHIIYVNCSLHLQSAPGLDSSTWPLLRSAHSYQGKQYPIMAQAAKRNQSTQLSTSNSSIHLCELGAVNSNPTVSRKDWPIRCTNISALALITSMYKTIAGLTLYHYLANSESRFWTDQKVIIIICSTINQ